MNWPDSPDGTVLRRLAEFKAELSNPAAKVET
jgi:hypothetical protein